MSGKHARETGLRFEKTSTFLTAVSTAPQFKPEEKRACALKKPFKTTNRRAGKHSLFFQLSLPGNVRSHAARL